MSSLRKKVDRDTSLSTYGRLRNPIWTGDDIKSGNYRVSKKISGGNFGMKKASRKTTQ
jgi:hypothetical protein